LILIPDPVGLTFVGGCTFAGTVVGGFVGVAIKLVKSDFDDASFRAAIGTIAAVSGLVILALAATMLPERVDLIPGDHLEWLGFPATISTLTGILGGLTGIYLRYFRKAISGRDRKDVAIGDTVWWPSAWAFVITLAILGAIELL
jgi:hypothetical protein